LIEAAGAIVAGRAPHSWRRVLVSVALGLIALAVVGMHQLSLGHLFVATADLSSDGHAHGTSSHAAMAAHAGAHLTAPASGKSMPMDSHGRSAILTAAAGASADDGCTGCSDHVMGPGTCLLALTLLVLFWWLRLPRPRALPPARRNPDPSVALPLGRPRVHALSLVELSILRT
jgi:hypothetical protein